MSREFFIDEKLGKYRVHFVMDGKPRYRTVSENITEAGEVLHELQKLISGGKSDNKKAVSIFNSCLPRQDKELMDMYEYSIMELEEENSFLKNELDNLKCMYTQQISYDNVVKDIFGNLSDSEKRCMIDCLHDYYKMRYQHISEADCSVRRTILTDILKRDSSDNYNKEIEESLYKILMDIGKKNISQIKYRLAELGLSIEKSADHYSIFRFDFPNYKVTVAATPSDYRVAENNVRIIMNKMF